MKKTITFFTSSRADYGILNPLMKEISNHPQFKIKIIVSGSHLSKNYGETINEIISDGLMVDEKIEMLLASDSKIGVAKSLGLGIIGYTDALDRLKTDLLIILGDRYEAFGIAGVATLMNIPIAHMHGGERTDGAYDEYLRHAITKLSHYHFVATETYRSRVIQMGESPEKVYNVGALGLENINSTTLYTLDECSEIMGKKICPPYFLITYHPPTLSNDNSSIGMAEIFQALQFFDNHQLIITYPNFDYGNTLIMKQIMKEEQERPDKIIVKKSLGIKLYHSLIKKASAVIGNSSSGIIEVPAFNVPTINIGNRQNGRLCAATIINCNNKANDIRRSIELSLDPQFMLEAAKMEKPYGVGNAAKKIVKILETINFTPIKTFHDIGYAQ